MRILKLIASFTLATVFIAAPVTGLAQAKKAEKAKPYPLEKCIVTGEKLGDHGRPYVFEHEGQEVKLCCKGCLKDFKKDSAKHMKKIEEARAAKSKKK
jgi:hypothetical protein